MRMDWFLTTAISNAIMASLLGCIALVVGRLRQHALAHAIWVLMLLKLLTPPVIEIPLHVLPDNAAASRDESPLNDGVQTDLFRRPAHELPAEPVETSTTLWQSILSPLPLLVAVWVVGGLVYLSRQLHVTVQAWKLMRHAEPSARIDRALHRVATAAELRNYPSARIAPWLGAPMLWGLGNQSVIVFPSALFDSLDDDAVASLLRHELAHYRRGDQWVRILQIVVTTVFWWHPMVWLAASELEAAEEQCCDAWVVAQDRSSRRRYAEAILDTVDFLSDKPATPLPVAASGLGRVPLLQRRIKAIMQGDVHGTLSTRGRVAVIALTTILPIQPALLPAKSPEREAAVTTVTDSSIQHARTSQSPAATDTPYAEAVSPDGNFVIAAFSGYRAEIIDRRTGRKLSLDDHQVTCVAFSPKIASSTFVAGTRNGTVELRDCRSAALLQNVAALSGPVRSIAISSDGKRLAVATGHKQVHLIEFAEPGKTRVLAGTHPARCVRFSSSNDRLVVVTGDSIGDEQSGRVDVWDLASEVCLFSVECPLAIGVAEIGPDGTLVTAEWDGTLRRWSESGAILATGRTAKDLVSAAAFSPDATSVFALRDIEHGNASPASEMRPE